MNSNGWIDCWSVPIIALSINYIYHPRPPLGPDPQADITTPEKEEILLSPMRIPKFQKSPVLHWKTQVSIIYLYMVFYNIIYAIMIVVHIFCNVHFLARN